MKIHASALKHGIEVADIEHAISGAGHRVLVGEDPIRWLYIGVDAATRALEIVTLEGQDGREVVIHAMKLRKKYHPKEGRS